MLALLAAASGHGLVPTACRPALEMGREPPCLAQLAADPGRAAGSGRSSLQGAPLQGVGPHTSPRPRFQRPLAALLLGSSLMRTGSVFLPVLVWEVTVQN